MTPKEKNPHYNLGMPGNLIGTMEKHNIARLSTEYNLWLLQILMNTFETDEEKGKGVNIFKKTL
jgi:hypothetical protein